MKSGQFTSYSALAFPRARGSNRLYDHGLQYFMVHVGEFLDVEAALASGVLAELGQQRLGVVGASYAVENRRGFARREADNRHIALTPTLVLVVVTAEADDGWSPHLRLFPGRVLQQFHERLGVVALGRVFDG